MTDPKHLHPIDEVVMPKFLDRVGTRRLADRDYEITALQRLGVFAAGVAVTLILLTVLEYLL